METIFHGTAGELHIGEPELYVDNQSRKRSGHMSHAMLEYAHGKIIAFNSNCSAERFHGHAAFGFIEYRYSDDGGKTWGEIHVLPYSMKVLLDGIYTISVEKAVFCNGVITLFALRNTQCHPICCEPWDTPLVIQSFDFGKTWTDPIEFSKYPGRIYDAVVHDGSIFALEHCCPHFYALPKERINSPNECVELTPEIVYRVYRSDDNGKSFDDLGPVDLDMAGYAYGSMQFRPDGSLVVYACNIPNGYLLGTSVSTDCGKTWMRQPVIRLDKGIRNVQVGMLNGKYIMHGRAYLDAPWGKGLVVYTSNDGLVWDDGCLLEPEKQGCYYSNNLTIKDNRGRERMLMQYSDGYDGTKVNVMHRWLSLESSLESSNALACNHLEDLPKDSTRASGEGTMMLPVNELFTQSARDAILAFYGSYEPVVELLKFRALPPVKVKTVFFGDSITAGFKFQEFFPGCSMLNRGIPGDSLDGLWARMKADVLPYEPEQVVVHAGINGIGEPNESMLRKYEAIGDCLASKGIHVWFCSVTPLRHGDKWDRFQYQGKIAELNDLICDMAQRKFAGVVDYFHAMLDEQGELKMEFAREDGTHITFAGYCAMAEVLKRNVELY